MLNTYLTKLKRTKKMSRKGIRYYVTADTHFGHDKLIDIANRPIRHDDIMMKHHHNLLNRPLQKTVLIHLGDFCIGLDEKWHDEFMDQLAIGTKCILTKGNHDRKTDTWYYNHGWDFVGEMIILNVYGLRILMSHKPQENLHGCDFNIHGHLHNTVHHKEYTGILTDKHILVAMEQTNYSPVSLQKLVRK